MSIDVGMISSSRRLQYLRTTPDRRWIFLGNSLFLLTVVWATNIVFMRLIKAKNCVFLIRSACDSIHRFDDLLEAEKTRCMLALISSSVCLFKLAHPIFLLIESIRSGFFLRCRDVAGEQVKQTFHVSVSLPPSPSPSPDNFSASINSYSCRALFSSPCWTNGKSVRELRCCSSSRDFVIVRSVELLFASFQVLRKQSEAKERLVIVLSSALWERRTGTQFLRIPSPTDACEYVCARAYVQYPRVDRLLP